MSLFKTRNILWNRSTIVSIQTQWFPFHFYSFFLQLYCFNQFNKDRQTGSGNRKGHPVWCLLSSPHRGCSLCPEPVPINRRHSAPADVLCGTLLPSPGAYTSHPAAGPCYPPRDMSTCYHWTPTHSGRWAKPIHAENIGRTYYSVPNHVTDAEPLIIMC